MSIILAVSAMLINVVALFFIVRKAVRADEQVELLKQLIAAQQLPKSVQKSPVAQLAEERAARGVRFHN